jgi:hypothetical protein
LRKYFKKSKFEVHPLDHSYISNKIQKERKLKKPVLNKKEFKEDLVANNVSPPDAINMQN